MASISSLGIGSGLDLNGLLDQLKEAEEEKLVPILEQQETQKTKISAYGQLQSALSQFQTSADALNDSALYESLSTNVGGSAITAAADAEAQPGSYNVTVNTLATRGTLASAGVTAATTADEPITTAAHKLTIDFVGNPSKEIDIAKNSSLEDIRDAINASEDSGVNATIINDGTNFRLALSASETGAAASITDFSFDGTAPFTSDTANTLQSGTDASLDVNGIDITSSTNQVEGAIQGVTLNLQEEGESTVKIEQDTLKVREAVTGFVNAYNDLKDKISDLTSFNSETGEAGELLGDSTIRTVESRLRSVLGGSVEGELSILSDIGISQKYDSERGYSKLEIDQGKLDDAIANNQDALSTFFAGDTDEAGMAGQINSTVEQLLSSNGRVAGAITGAENLKTSLVERYASMEQSIGQTISRYRTQFSQLDGIIAQMNQTSSYLTKQFDALDAQLGRD